MPTEEVIFSTFGMKCSLVGGKVKALGVFSKPLEPDKECELDYEFTRQWEERLQCHIDAMRNDFPAMYEAWINKLSTNEVTEL